jgi:type IV secretory pathway VirB2 component (pilin)
MITNRLDRYFRNVVTFGICALMCVAVCEPALAQSSSSGGATDFTAFLQNVVNLLTGTAGKLIAVIIVSVLGIMTATGRMAMHTFFLVLLGIGMLFSAQWIVNQITGGTS